MPRSLGGTAFEPLEEGRDREITFGPTLLAVLGLGLFALCSLCFVGGYALGHRGQALSSAAPAPSSGPSAAQLLSGQSKPAATDNVFQPRVETLPANSAQGAAPATEAAPAAQPSAAEAPNQVSSSSPAPAVVHAALPAQGNVAQTASTAGQVQAALPQAGAWMVQIAAVSHAEDADVLMGALRQRGYAVSMRRDPVDNLIHVQVGPFSARADAVTMRQRLLNDGYNAVIEP